MTSLASAFRSLNHEIGLVDIILPFLLIFTIIFAILQKSSLLGDGKKNLNMVVAIVIGLMVVIPHVTGQYGSLDPVDIINEAIPQVSLVVVAIVMLLILIGVFGQEKVFLGMSMPGWVALFSFAAIIYIFGNSAGFFGTTSFFSGIDDEVISIIVMILIFGIVIAFITGGDEGREDISALKRVGFDLGKLFGK